MNERNKAKVSYSDSEWRQRLTPDQYAICRQKGTERPFSGQYASTEESGHYHCSACGERLFSSIAKYDSGSGWPSFYDGLSDKIKTETDNSLGMARTEIMCAKCGGHLGHIFNDGPQPTGQRYCVNSVSLDFTPKDENTSNDEK